MKAVAKKIQVGYSQTKYRMFHQDHFYTDENKEYVDQTKGLALVYFNPNQDYLFKYNWKGEEVLHSGDEKTFGEYFGLKIRF